jgi:hypothetical protein
MHPDQLLSETVDESGEETLSLNVELLRQILEADATRPSDVDAMDGVVRLLRREIENYSSRGWSHLTGQDLEALNRAYRVLSARIGVESQRLPFRDWTEYERWRRRENWAHLEQIEAIYTEDGYWDDFFGQLEGHILDALEASWTHDLIQTVSPHKETGWALVDSEIGELRRKFATARTASDHSAIGLQSVRVLEQLATVAYVQDVHGRFADGEPTKGETKKRFDAIIAAHATGKENELLRKTAKSVVELAQQVKHRHTPSREDAGIAADSVIVLVNLIRRLSNRPVFAQSTMREASPVARNSSH